MASFGLYGNAYPALITVSGSISIGLDNSVIQKDEPEWEYKVFQSVITGHRTIKRKGAHWVVELIYYVYKVGTISQQHTKADTLQDLLWNDTAFFYYRHANGDALRDSSGNGIAFKLVEFRPFNVTTTDYKDAIYMKMVSTDYVKVVPYINS